MKLCILYGLPHPLDLLTSSLTKPAFKSMVKKRVLDHWESLLRSESISLPSLASFRPAFMSLTTPHPIWTTAGSSPANVAMATVQAVMVSGRYRTEALCSHWSQNRKGMCLLSKDCNDVLEDLTHILQICPGLSRFRQNLNKFTQEYSEKLENPDIQVVLLGHCNVSHPLFKDFLLDCSSLPQVIACVQRHGHDVLYHLFRVTRTWIYVLHRERLKILGRWNKYV